MIEASYKNSEELPAVFKLSEADILSLMPRMDWDRPPWNRWSFQRIRSLMPTAQVWRGNEKIIPIPRQEKDISQIEFTRSNGVSQTVEVFLDDTYTDGFLVMTDGFIVHESYYNGMRPETPHLMQSVSKSITSTVTGIMIGRGDLDPSALVKTYIPELAETAWAGQRFSMFWI